MNKDAIRQLLKRLRLGWILSAYRFLRQLLRICVHRIITPFRIKRYFRKTDETRVQFGSGDHLLDGWLNVDIEPCAGTVYGDATRKLRFPDVSVQLIFAEHLIEHILLADARRFLAECYRVMRLGGTIRISTPDLGCMVRIYQGESVAGLDIAEVFSRCDQAWYGGLPEHDRCTWINRLCHGWGHRFMYDEGKLCQVLTDAGFVDVKRVSFGASEVEELNGIETHKEFEGWDEVMNLVVEARKPS